jgi:hypothetical protein
MIHPDPYVLYGNDKSGQKNSIKAEIEVLFRGFPVMVPPDEDYMTVQAV